MKILMPQLGETVTEGVISEWHIAEGATVSKGDLLLDVETDKVATEIPAPEDGTLVRILVPQGETVAVGTVLALFDDGSGIEDDELESEAPEPASAPAAVAEPAPAAVPAAPASRPTGRSAASGDAPRLSPAVRQLLRKHGLDASEVPASGSSGRLTRDDVLAHVENMASGGADSSATRMEFNRVRRLTAEHMVRSKATSPHVLQAIEVDFGRVDQARKANGADWKAAHGHSLTYLPFVARAVCSGLEAFPRLNASVDGDALLIHPDIHLAVAVDLNFEGVMTPVVRNAASLDLASLALALRGAIDKVRSGTAGMDDLRGGTYTLSNPGPFGTYFTAPIINQPQVGILSMDAIARRPVVVGEGEGEEIAIRPVGVLAQSFDHRAVDGAYSAAFLKHVRDVIQDTDWSSEL